MRAWVLVLGVVAGCGAKSQLRQPPPSSMDARLDDAFVAIDGGTDAGFDAGSDAGSDTGADAGSDAGFDTGVDAGSDAGSDAGRDGGHDAAILPTTGCADGQREGFRDAVRYPDIAGCAGGWTRPGVAHPAIASCGGQAGDDGPFPAGGTCGTSDFCDVGWHVCLSPDDVSASSPDGCGGSHDAPAAFFVTRMSGPGCGVCATGTSTSCTAVDCRHDCAPTAATVNDVFGCGTLGDPPDGTTCGVFDRFSNDQCTDLLPPWRCTDDGSGTHEAELLVKLGPDHGGVLCCRDR